MSRTYRKPKLVVEETKEQYVRRRMERLYTHYTVETYMTESDEKAYEKAHEEYEIAYHIWVNLSRDIRFNFHRRPTEPYKYQFMRHRYTKVEYDYEAKAKEFTKEYEKMKRDSHFYESERNTSYKKHCSKDLRHKNKEVIRKILKDDESWEDKPFPDTYLGKQYVWDYW